MAVRGGWCMVVVWLAGYCLPAVSAGESVAERRERVMQSAAEGTAGLRVLQAALADESPLLRRPAGGAFPVRLDLAPNDAPGAWTVRARELASGRTAEVRFP